MPHEEIRIPLDLSDAIALRDEWKRQFRLMEAAEAKAEEQIATLEDELKIVNEERIKLVLKSNEQENIIAALTAVLSFECYMWQAPERGKLTGTEQEIAKLLRATNGDFAQFINDLKRHKFADVTFCNNEVTLINRRMQREEKERGNTRLRVSRFRSNAACNANVTVPSPSPSPSPKEKKKEKKITLPDDEWLKTLEDNSIYRELEVRILYGKMPQARGIRSPQSPGPKRIPAPRTDGTGDHREGTPAEGR